MHDKHGYFDPKYKYCGDYELWVRAAKQKSIFKKMHSALSLYYRNPDGLSTKTENLNPAYEEIQKIRQ